MQDNLIKAAVAFVGGAVASVIGIFVCHKISKSNIIEKIKKIFRKKAKKTKDEKYENLFSAVIGEKQEKSVNVRVFFGLKAEKMEFEDVQLKGKVDDDVQQGEEICLVD